MTEVNNQCSKISLNSSSNNHSSQTKVLCKIEKLKQKISQSNNYLQLQQPIAQLDKIKFKLLNSSNGNKDILKLIQKCQKLIKQKMKYFKKIIFRKIQQSNQDDDNHKQTKKETKKTNLNHNTLDSKKPNTNTQQQQINFNQFNKKNKYTHENQQKQLYQSMKESMKQEKQKQKNQSFNHHRTNSPTSSLKLLKMSKSADNLQKLKQSFTFRNDQTLLKNFQIQNQFQDDKTQIKGYGQKFIQSTNQQLQKQLNYYKNKTLQFQKHLMNPNINGSSIIFSEFQSNISDQFNYKIREKTLQLEQLKGRVKYYEQTNQQLKNRLLNEQRRHQDYIDGLKLHIKNQDQQITKQAKQRKCAIQLIKKYQHRIQSLQKDQIKCLQQLESVLRENDKIKLKQKQTSDDDVRKELQAMSIQQQYIRNLDKALKQQQMTNKILQQKYQKGNKQLCQVRNELSYQMDEKDQYEQLLQLKLQQNESYKTQLHRQRLQISQLNQELSRTKQELDRIMKQQDQVQKQKQRIMHKKMDKLKEVKNLLIIDQ